MNVVNRIKEISLSESPTLDDILFLLSLHDQSSLEILRNAAFNLTTQMTGNQVWFRGIIELSNICRCDCNYCGIRKSNKAVPRYQLTKEEIVSAAMWAAQAGYGSCVLQSGERKDPWYTDFIEECLIAIKQQSTSTCMPHGLGITLSLGEQTPETYVRWHKAGAHRYLLRMETTHPPLFSSLHPAQQTFENRIESLHHLKKAGYLVGTGVMIGLPGQTPENLAHDILFFKNEDIDMIGMGPYLVAENTPMKKMGMMGKEELLELSLKMIAVTRLICKNINIASTTALQALEPTGREKGIRYGANILMPNLTPRKYRSYYQLYDHKPCIDEGREACRLCIRQRVTSTGRSIGTYDYGDARRPDHA